MTTWAVAMFWALLGLAVGQAIAARRFLRVLRQVPSPPTADPACPKVAVILCLRGTDPFLSACIDAILRQDYPEYDLHIVVDSPHDPAWRLAEEAVKTHPGRTIRLKTLKVRLPACSLKCSSLVQAVSELDDSVEVVALLDADTIAHRTWLRELVAPLADDHVAAATGNRWYAPAAVSWGSLIRRLWNTAAVVHMWMFRIPWGGTLALKLSVVRQSDLLERWARALCEDTMLYRVLRRQGRRVAFVPSLMMINREQCGTGDFFRWVRRQLLTTRLYHPAWGAIVAHGAGISAALGTGFVLLIAAAIAREARAVAWLTAGMASYWIIMAALLTTIEDGVRRNMQARNEPVTKMRLSDWPRTLIAMLLTQMVYTAALASTLFLRVVDWRGVRYRVDGPWKIRLLEYKPYANGEGSQPTLQSL